MYIGGLGCGWGYRHPFLSSIGRAANFACGAALGMGALGMAFGGLGCGGFGWGYPMFSPFGFGCGNMMSYFGMGPCGWGGAIPNMWWGTGLCPGM